MSREALVPGEGEPVLINDTDTKQRLAQGPALINENSSGGGGAVTRRRQMPVVN